jgi:hypothetical protein
VEIDGFRNVPGMYYTSFGGGLGGRLYRRSTVAEVVVVVLHVVVKVPAVLVSET